MKTLASLIFCSSAIVFWFYGISIFNQTHPGWAGALGTLTIVAGAVAASKRND